VPEAVQVTGAGSTLLLVTGAAASELGNGASVSGPSSPSFVAWERILQGNTRLFVLASLYGTGLPLERPWEARSTLLGSRRSTRLCGLPLWCFAVRQERELSSRHWGVNSDDPIQAFERFGVARG
jgi:hypothetical protein